MAEESALNSIPESQFQIPNFRSPELSADYCREIEAYLCRKNDGHLVRVVGPSFELVSGWEAGGIPIKVAFRGIDRYFERYYRQGPRRRPVRIDFCDADVRDVFDEWRRAVGIAANSSHEAGAGSDDESASEAPASRGRSLPKHLERALLRLSSARATGQLGAEADNLIDRVSNELDAARATARGLRGAAREALLKRLEDVDVELVGTVLGSLADADRRTMELEAEEELRPYRASMTPESYNRALAAAIARLARDRFGLPTLSL